MNWDDAKYFLAVARAGQMLSAAARLGTSQAKVSRRVTALETSLGCKLFERSTNGCELTSDGQLIFEIATSVENDFLQMQSASRRSHSEVSGTIRIGAPDGFGVGFLASRIPLLNDKYPNLTIELVPVPRRFSLSKREADIAIMVGRPERGRLRVRKLTDYALGLYASRGYLEKAGTPASLADLSQHRLVGYVDDLLFTEQLSFEAEYSSAWSANIRISSAIGQIEAVKNGAGIGVLHDFMAANATDLVPIFPEKKVTRTYWTVFHESMKDTRRVAVVTEFLNDIARDNKTLFVPD